MSSSPATPQTAWIAIGGNLGDVEATFAKAISLFDQLTAIDVRQMSSVHRTSPVGERAGAPFVNAVAQLTTTLAPLELLDRLQSIETELGRVRTVRWGPRTLDLDLLMYDDAVIDHPRLQVPHPACWYRRFVLDPWVEIGEDVVHPVKQLTIRQLRNRLLVRPMSITLVGGVRERRDELVRTLKLALPEIRWSAEIDLEVEPTLSIGLGPVDHAESYAAIRQMFVVSWLELGKPVTSEIDAIREIVHSARGA